jgi:hypothetical protein
MARFHRAEITPGKADLIAAWAPTRPWGPPADLPIDVIGAFRFDDPDGRVGMETHLVTFGDTLFQVPLTYRDAPLDGGEGAFIGEMEHSALGTRWVYDGLGDPAFLVMLAAVTMTGQGEALGLAVYEDRWYIAPTNVRIQGGGWSLERVPVDGWQSDAGDDVTARFRNDRFTLTAHRAPVVAPRPTMALTATWPAQDAPVLLAEVAETR